MLLLLRLPKPTTKPSSTKPATPSTKPTKPTTKGRGRGRSPKIKIHQLFIGGVLAPSFLFPLFSDPPNVKTSLAAPSVGLFSLLGVFFLALF